MGKSRSGAERRALASREGVAVGRTGGFLSVFGGGFVAMVTSGLAKIEGRLVFAMKSAFFRAAVMGLGVLLAGTASAQQISSVNLEFMTGDRGLADVNQLTLEFQGERGMTVATGRVSPPRGTGWAARTRQSVTVRLDRTVAVRKIARVLFQVSNREGGRVFDSWDLNSASLRNGTQLLMNAPSIGVRFSDLRQSWRSPDWPTFDPDGTKTKTTNWQLVTETGGDDLRDDNVASYIVIWRDGTFSGFALENLPGGNARIDPLRVLAPGRAVTDLHKVLLTTAFPQMVPYAANVNQQTGYAPTRTEDFWDLDAATIRAVMPDGETIQRPLARLAGRYSFRSMGMHSFANVIELGGTVARPRAGTDVAILLWVESENFNVGGTPADIEAALVQEGSSVPTTVVTRRTADQPLFGNSAAMWSGQPPSGLRLRYMQLISQTVRPWDRTRGEITGLRIRLRDFPSSSTRPYSGPSTLTIKGYALMQRVGTSRDPFDARTVQRAPNEWVFLTADARQVTLSAGQPEVTLPVRYLRAR